MGTRNSGLRVLDLYCGAGGFSEGFRQAGFDVVVGVDNWKPARDTHEFNGLGESINQDMFELIDEGGFQKAKQLAKHIEKKYGRIDVLIGSPPCTEFSYAKKGGKGDIEKGMLLVRAYLVFVTALQPRFWLMENVPRLKHAIGIESSRENAHGWHIPLVRLGVDDNLSKSHLVDDLCLSIPHGKVYLASDFGAPQDRKRFIAGNLDSAYVDKLKLGAKITMRRCLEKLEKEASSKKKRIRDPNYPHHSIKRELLRDYFYDTRVHPMYWEEMRHLKRRHIQYGKMVLPDNLDRPARTIMATSNPSSREAVTFDTGEKMLYQGKERSILKQPTVREIACLQGFPIGFQFVGETLSARYRLVGNAVPCQLSYSLALATLNAFRDIGYEDSNQEDRCNVTVRRNHENRGRPILHPAGRAVEEAKDFLESKYMEFRAKPNKHFRRRILSAKPRNTSAMVIFENTEWHDESKRSGGFWKSCMQLGVGKRFSQVYLDEVSVPIILDALDNCLVRSDTLKDGQTTLVEIVTEDRLGGIRQLCAELMSEIDKGLPVVNYEWVEFPGFFGPDAERYLEFPVLDSKPLPSVSLFQTMFTSHVPDSGGFIGPIDFFDGIDAIMLHSIAKSGRSWIPETTIRLKDLVDVGDSLHGKRIHPGAAHFIDGILPLVTLIGALISVHILYRMHSEEKRREHPMYASLQKAWKAVASWCQFES